MTPHSGPAAREINLLIINERGLWKKNMRRVEEAFLGLKSRALPIDGAAFGNNGKSRGTIRRCGEPSRPRNASP